MSFQTIFHIRRSMLGELELMRRRMNKVNGVKCIILLFSVTVLLTGGLLFIFSCGAGVDIGEADKVLTSFEIVWPANFNELCYSGAGVDITIKALDQTGRVFNWAGTIEIILTIPDNVSVTPEFATLLNGSKQTTIEFVNETMDDQQTGIVIKYQDTITMLDEEIVVLKVGGEIPQNVLATDGYSHEKVIVTWDFVPYAEYYEVYRSELVSGTYSLLDSTTATRYDDTTSVWGREYYYMVKAYMPGFGLSEYSDYDSGYKWNYYLEFQVGSEGTGNGQFDTPYDAAADSAGNIYVADTSNNRIQKFDKNGNFIAVLGGPGTENGQFYSPWSIAIDSDDNIYVADKSNERIQKFDSNWTFLTKWGSLGSGEGQFRSPQGVGVVDGYVYVADCYNHRIQKFNSNGTFITEWGGTFGSPGSGDGQFRYPTGVAIDSSGYVYVSDGENKRVQKFDSNGSFITKWGSSGSGDGQFSYPYDIEVDSNNNIHVCDVAGISNSRIEIFDTNGNLISIWDTPIGPYGVGAGSGDGMGIAGPHKILKIALSGYILQWGGYGTDNGLFWEPEGIASDTSGNVYVVEARGSRVQKFDSEGTFITKWGSFGTGDSEFNNASAIAVDSGDNVYVADSGNNRVQKFDSNGNLQNKWSVAVRGIAVDSADNVYVTNNYSVQKFDSDGNPITSWGSQGSGDGQFENAYGIALDSDDNVFVVDSQNHNVQKFNSDGVFTAKYGSEGSADGLFNRPFDITIDLDDNFYVTDYLNHRIQKFDSNGNFITKWGSSGTGNGQFAIPTGIESTPSGFVYVVDSNSYLLTDNHRIQKFHY